MTSFYSSPSFAFFVFCFYCCYYLFHLTVWCYSRKSECCIILFFSNIYICRRPNSDSGQSRIRLTHSTILVWTSPILDYQKSFHYNSDSCRCRGWIGNFVGELYCNTIASGFAIIDKAIGLGFQHSYTIFYKKWSSIENYL